jgi:hypothetical protein
VFLSGIFDKLCIIRCKFPLLKFLERRRENPKDVLMETDYGGPSNKILNGFNLGTCGLWTHILA